MAKFDSRGRETWGTPSDVGGRTSICAHDDDDDDDDDDDE